MALHTLIRSLMIVHILPCLWTATAFVVNTGTVCEVYPESERSLGHPVDDTSSILEAFQLCGINGTIKFSHSQYHINQVMNTTNLLNCEIQLPGEFLWSSNVPYWLSHSFPVTFQNLSTAWLLGGSNITLRGYGTGTLNGNGQTWYDENRNNSNQPGRPIGLTIYDSKNVLIDGLNFYQSQFWSSFVSFSENVIMSNINVHSVSNSSNTAINTDGCDSWNSNHVRWYNWTVHNGDDCLAVKGNSTDIIGRNISCTAGYGIPIGSVGQVPGSPDYVQDVLFEDCVLNDCFDGAYIKAWQGAPTTITGNGDSGGGGGGWARNVTFKNFTVRNVTVPIYVTECIYGGDPSVCDTSNFQLSDITWQNFTGYSKYDIVSSIHCGAKVPCPGFRFVDIDIKTYNETVGIPSLPPVFQCANIVGQNDTGLQSPGIPCNQWAPNDVPQVPSGNF